VGKWHRFLLLPMSPVLALARVRTGLPAEKTYSIDVADRGREHGTNILKIARRA
jgi:hypothetical protein